MIDTSKIPASRLKQETFDNKPQDGSGNVISSGAVYNALKEKLDATDTAVKAKADAIRARSMNVTKVLPLLLHCDFHHI